MDNDEIEARGQRMAKRMMNMTIREIEAMMRELYRNGVLIAMQLNTYPANKNDESLDFEVKVKPAAASQSPEPSQD